MRNWILLLVLWPAALACAQTYEGRVVSIQDGDTVRVLYRGGELKIRLAEIDAPEIGHGRKKPGQPHGGDARRALSALVFGREVRVEQQDRDRYGRVVGRVFVGPVDVNAALVRDGWAWVYRRYSRDPALPPLEEAARAARRGLWAAPHPVPRRRPRARPPSPAPRPASVAVNGFAGRWRRARRRGSTWRRAACVAWTVIATARRAKASAAEVRAGTGVTGRRLMRRISSIRRALMQYEIIRYEIPFTRRGLVGRDPARPPQDPPSQPEIRA